MRTKSLIVTALVAILFAVGCKKDKEDPAPELTGYWNGNINLDGNNYSINFDLEQDERTISGYFQFSDGSGHTTISGSISENHVSMYCSTAEGVDFSWSGTANDERNSMSGTVNSLYGGYVRSGIPWNAAKTASGGSAKAVPAGKTMSESVISLIR